MHSIHYSQYCYLGCINKLRRILNVYKTYYCITVNFFHIIFYIIGWRKSMHVKFRHLYNWCIYVLSKSVITRIDLYYKKGCYRNRCWSSINKAHRTGKSKLEIHWFRKKNHVTRLALRWSPSQMGGGRSSSSLTHVPSLSLLCCGQYLVILNNATMGLIVLKVILHRSQVESPYYTIGMECGVDLTFYHDMQISWPNSVSHPIRLPDC